MKAMKFVLPAAIATAIAAPASAQESASAASHYYVGANVGSGHWRSMCQNAPSCDDTNTTLGVFAGYRINPIFSAELGFRNYGMVHASTASVKARAGRSMASLRGRCSSTCRFSASSASSARSSKAMAR